MVETPLVTVNSAQYTEDDELTELAFQPVDHLEQYNRTNPLPSYRAERQTHEPASDYDGFEEIWDVKEYKKKIPGLGVFPTTATINIDDPYDTEHGLAEQLWLYTPEGTDFWAKHRAITGEDLRNK